MSHGAQFRPPKTTTHPHSPSSPLTNTLFAPSPHVGHLVISWEHTVPYILPVIVTVNALSARTFATTALSPNDPSLQGTASIPHHNLLD
jgi:hypothetical protein